MFHLLKVTSIPGMSFFLFLEKTVSLANQPLNLLGNPGQTSFETNFLNGKTNWEIPLSITVLRVIQISSTVLVS